MWRTEYIYKATEKAAHYSSNLSNATDIESNPVITVTQQM